MKVKILLTPLLLILSVAMIIWFVYPAFNVMLDKRQDLIVLNEKNDELVQKEKVINSLMSTLNESVEEQSTVMKFLPEERNEDEIISNLNSIATREGLSIFQLSVMQPEKDVKVVESDNLVNDSGLKLEVNSSKNKIKDFDVNLSVYGGYENIKNVISNVYKLKRFNKVSELEISKDGPIGGDGNPANLMANFVFSFNYLPKIDLVTSVDDKVFTEGKFNMGVVSKINEFKSYDFYKLSPSPSGRTNPFLP